MPIVLPLLKLSLAVQSTWDAYKALRPPRSLSERAIAQRKRSMKAVLSVWVVWAAVSILERPLDSTIGIVMPFYGEAKNVVFFALLIFRSFIAEPIVLRIIRPFLKPYSKQIDGVIDLFSLFGTLLVGFFGGLLAIPLAAWRRVWHRWDETPLFGIRVRPLSAISPEASSSSSEEDQQPQARDSGSEASIVPTRQRVRPISRREQLDNANRAAQPVLADIDSAATRHRDAREQSQARFGSYDNNLQSRPRPSSRTEAPRASSRSSQKEPTRSAQYSTVSAGSGSSIRQPQRNGSGSSTHSIQQAPGRGSSSTRPPQRSGSGSSTHTVHQVSGAAGSATTHTYFHPRDDTTSTFQPDATSTPSTTHSRRSSNSTLPAFERNMTRGETGAAAAEIAASRPSRSPSWSESVPSETANSVRLMGIVPDTPARFPGALPFDTPVQRIPVLPDLTEAQAIEAAVDSMPPPDAPVGILTDGNVGLPEVEVEFVGRSSRITRARSSVREVPQPHMAHLSKAMTKGTSRSAFPNTLAATSTSKPQPYRTNSIGKKAGTKRVHEPERDEVDPNEKLDDDAEADAKGNESDTASDASSVVKKRRVVGGRVARKIALIEDEKKLVPSGDEDDIASEGARQPVKPPVKGKPPPPPPASTKPALIRGGSLRGSAGSSKSAFGNGAGLVRAASSGGAVTPSNGSIRSQTTRSRTAESKQ